MSKDTKLLKLKEFLVHNEELELLEARLEEFNPLAVLSLEKQEIKHSKILAWLLDPEGNHGLGDKVFKKFLCELCLSGAAELPFTIDAVQTKSFNDIKVFTERENIDILIQSKNHKFVILIENKIYSKAKEAQVRGYVDKIKARHPDHMVIPVLLTLLDFDCDENEDRFRGIFLFSHERIYRIVRFLAELYKNNINAKVMDFINFYLKTLGVLTMQENNEIVRLCKEIYRRHKDAIDVINDYGVTSPLNEAMERFMEGKGLVESFRNKSSLWFVPEEFSRTMPKVVKGWSSEYPVSYWFRFEQKWNKLGLILEVGPFSADKRAEFIKRIDGAKHFKIGKKGFEPERSYTRIFSKYHAFEEWENMDSVVKTMEELFNDGKTKEATKNMIKILDKFEW